VKSEVAAEEALVIEAATKSAACMKASRETAATKSTERSAPHSANGSGAHSTARSAAHSSAGTTAHSAATSVAAALGKYWKSTN
jgi:hypothetical protein